MKSLSVLILGSLFALSSVAVGGIGSPASAKDTMEVVRDKDKTSYVIDSDDSEYLKEQERDKQNAWKMLQNGNLWIDGRNGRRPPQGAGQ